MFLPSRACFRIDQTPRTRWTRRCIVVRWPRACRCLPRSWPRSSAWSRRGASRGSHPSAATNAAAARAGDSALRRNLRRFTHARRSATASGGWQARLRSDVAFKLDDASDGEIEVAYDRICAGQLGPLLVAARHKFASYRGLLLGCEQSMPRNYPRPGEVDHEPLENHRSDVLTHPVPFHSQMLVSQMFGFPNCSQHLPKARLFPSLQHEIYAVHCSREIAFSHSLSVVFVSQCGSE